MSDSYFPPSAMSDVLDTVYEQKLEEMANVTPESAALATIRESLEGLTMNLCEMGLEDVTPDLNGWVSGMIETIIWIRSKEESFLLSVTDHDWNF